MLYSPIYVVMTNGPLWPIWSSPQSNPRSLIYIHEAPLHSIYRSCCMTMFQVVLAVLFTCLSMCTFQARKQMFVTCLFNVPKCLQILKHSIKVFNEHLVDICKDCSECEIVCVWLGRHFVV